MYEHEWKQEKIQEKIPRSKMQILKHLNVTVVYTYPLCLQKIRQFPLLLHLFGWSVTCSYARISGMHAWDV